MKKKNPKKTNEIYKEEKRIKKSKETEKESKIY